MTATRADFGAPSSHPDYEAVDNHQRHVGVGPNIDVAHQAIDAHGRTGDVEQSPHPIPGGDDRPAPAIVEPTSSPASLVLADPLLALAADVLDDLEHVRIANENRLRQLTRTETDTDGIDRGFGLDIRHPDVARLDALVDDLRRAEHDAELQLGRALRRHPLGPWIKATSGIGEKQGARLLATIGDPYWHDLHNRPRLVSELWSYCGYGDATAQVRRRGERAAWSADAKMRAHLVAASCVKVLRKPCTRPDDQPWANHVNGCRCSPYRLVYDEGRRRYADSVHPRECRRCGPSGHPAPAGSPRSDGHCEAMAVRLAAKRLLRDLWAAAGRLHGDNP